jgi:hypothetical protein
MMKKTSAEAIHILAVRRAQLNNTLERVAFDNNPSNGPIGVRLAAMLEEDNMEPIRHALKSPWRCCK